MPASRMTTTVCEESIPCVSNPGELSSIQCRHILVHLVSNLGVTLRQVNDRYFLMKCVVGERNIIDPSSPTFTQIKHDISANNHKLQTLTRLPS